MAFYRLYFLFDGHIVDNRSFHATADVHAETIVELAWQTKSVRCDGMELWSDKRRVRCKEAPRNGIEMRRPSSEMLRPAQLSAQETPERDQTTDLTKKGCG
jgi:hypothetical protein